MNINTKVEYIVLLAGEIINYFIYSETINLLLPTMYADRL